MLVNHIYATKTNLGQRQTISLYMRFLTANYTFRSPFYRLSLYDKINDIIGHHLCTIGDVKSMGFTQNPCLKALCPVRGHLFCSDIALSMDKRVPSFTALQPYICIRTRSYQLLCSHTLSLACL